MFIYSFSFFLSFLNCDHASSQSFNYYVSPIPKIELPAAANSQMHVIGFLQTIVQADVSLAPVQAINSPALFTVGHW
jgi:hypothetical protein